MNTGANAAQQDIGTYCQAHAGSGSPVMSKSAGRR